MKRKLLLIILVLSMLLLPVSGTRMLQSAKAAGPTCYVDDTAIGGNDGSSWAGAFTDLQSALSDTGCTRIEVAEGTYIPTLPSIPGFPGAATFQLRNGLEIFGGYPNGGGMRDPGTYMTILDGNGGDPYIIEDNSYHVVTGSGVDSSSVLDGFTIQWGYAGTGMVGDPMLGYGGGIAINSGSPILNNLVITLNYATYGGGGISLRNSSPILHNLVIYDNSVLASGGGMHLFNSSPTITDVAFQNNEALGSGSWGGGLSIYGVSQPSMTQVEFSGNSAWNGGGVYCEGAWNVQLSNVIFHDNSADMGGGLNLDNCGVTMENVSFDQNIASSLGGGMFTLNGIGLLSPTLSQVTFTGNTASDGGGLYSNSGDINIIGATFSSNQAVNGGGLYIDSTSGSFTSMTVTDNQADMGTGSGGGIFTYYGPSPNITNLLLAGNSAWRGGGMANYYYSDPEIVNATIYGNQASDLGSAIYNYQSSPSLTNSIVWGNTETVPGPDIVDDGPASSPSIAFSILEEGCPAGATCTDVISNSPRFVDPAGGNLRLQAASPAIDAGDNAALPIGITTDLDGQPRFVDVPGVMDTGSGTPPVVDMGSYEAHYGSDLIIYVDQDASGPVHDGTSWITAYADLQNALAVAVEGDQLWVADGTYYPGSLGDPRTVTFQLDRGMSLYGGFAGTEGSLEERDLLANPTILSGDLDRDGLLDDGNAYHVVSSSGYVTNTLLTMDGFTIQSGNADSGGTLGYGGGMYCEGATSAQLSNMTFLENVANIGGGLYLNYCSMALENVNFIQNSAISDGGGGYFINSAIEIMTATVSLNSAADGGGIFVIGDNSILTDVTFNDNIGNTLGGGLLIYGDATLTRVTFYGNSAALGGGMWSGPFGSDANISIHSSRFEANSASGAGGGLYINSFVNTTIQDSQFISNTSINVGGGLSVLGSLNMVDSILDQNSTAGSGGGMAYSVGTSPSSLTNVSVTGNQADSSSGYGGGIYAFQASIHISNLLLSNNSAWRGGGMTNYYNSVPEIVNATIYGNHANDTGRAIYNDQSSPAFTNAIVWGNSGGGFEIVDGNSSTSIIAESILEDGCPLGATCTDVISSDPLFIDPLNGDFSLSTTSPAVDAGDVSALPADTFDLDGDTVLTETIPFDLNGNRRVVVNRVDAGAYEAQLWNTNWTEAAHLSLIEGLPNIYSATVDRYLDQEGQSRWYKFTIQPESKVLVTLTDLPANYDLTLYKDIAQAYNELNSPQDLVRLSAEFAPDTFSPDTFSPDTFSPDTFSPDTFSPDTFSPDTFSPDTFSPDTFSPDTFSPDTFSPDTFSPDTFSPDTFSPDTFSPDTFSPDTFSPDTFSPDTFSPDTFSSAQTRSLIAASAYEGTMGEGILVNTWLKSGDFYLRVRGRNGVYDPNNPFHLQVTLLSGVCGQINPVLPASDTTLVDGDYQTLILTNPTRIEGSPEELAQLQTNLEVLATATNGIVIDVGTDARVSAAALQSETNPACVYAKNLEAYAVKEIIDGFRAINPLEYIVLVGNDQSIPYFRYPDNALLASETGYSPPVRDNTTSQASLKMGYYLTQDTYGAAIELSNKAQILPIPELATGRLVETASDINHLIQAYLATGDGIIYPANALVTGYDFLEDAANAVRDELQAGLGDGTVDTLIMSNELSPEDPLAWTADDMSTSLFGSTHDIVFLASHFSASGLLAADYQTRLTASEVLASGTDFTNSLVYSAGCHSGYNIVNEHDVINVTEEPDWSQAFAAKGATFIGGTGYQYGDTEFIEYSERLYLEFTRQLRYGSDPVAVGKALAEAKKIYLANTPLMRGIHEKSVLEATLFGLPMMSVDLPNRTSPPVEASIVSTTTAFETNPGLSLGLVYTDVQLTTTLSEMMITLDVISQSGGDPSQVTASYLQGPDGVVVNPAEPVMPLDMLNVTHPMSITYVLRGIGWRGGAYTDLPDWLSLTGAATEDLRAPHPAFFSDIFYPVRPWNINYFDALSNQGGATRLALMPAQYRSSSPDSLTGILRRFDTMDFRLYYSSNIDSYTDPDTDWTNIPALSAPPDISHITSSIDEVAGTVSFEATVVGDPAAGIQEVWIVYTFESGGSSGEWHLLDLGQTADTRVWQATLATGGIPAEDLRFIVQAVNGVGLVTMMTNEGAYYRAGVNPGAPPLGETPVSLMLDNPPTEGEFGGRASFTAILTTDGNPLAGVPVTFHLGGQGRLAVTDSAGQATVSFFLLAQPDEYTVSAMFAGDETYAPSSDSSSFEVVPGISAVSLQPTTLDVYYTTTSHFTATVTSGGLPLSLKPVALTLIDAGGAVFYTNVAVTDYAGRVSWEVPPQPLGDYTVTAWFGLPVSPELDLSTPYYTGATASSMLVVNPFNFSGFFPPIENPPVLNVVKAGRAVPVKFSLDGYYGLEVFASDYPASADFPCETGEVNPLEDTVSAGASRLEYDPATDQYIYVWKTDKNWANTCRTLTLKFIDGTERTALFQFSK